MLYDVKYKTLNKAEMAKPNPSLSKTRLTSSKPFPQSVNQYIL